MTDSIKLISEVKQLIENNYCDPGFNVNRLCYITRVSRTSIYRKIMSCCNCSPQELIEDVRLEIAKQKILEDESIIKEIAYEVGFSDPHYFSKRFKQKFNITPSAFKKTFESSLLA